MDEVEYRMTYNQACNAIQADDWKKACLLILQLLDSQQQTIEDMQRDEDDC